MSDMTPIGLRLRRFRKDAGLNQTQLAAVAGVTQSMISDYESKGVMFQADVLEKMAHALGVSMEAIMSGETLPDQQELDLLRLYRTMPEESRHTLMATARTFANIPTPQRKRSNGA